MEPVALEDFICFDNGLNRLGNFADVGNGDRDVLVVSGDLRRLGILPVSVRDQTLAVGLKQRNGCADGSVCDNVLCLAVCLQLNILFLCGTIGIANDRMNREGSILVECGVVKVLENLPDSDLAGLIVIGEGNVCSGRTADCVCLRNIELACCSVLFNFDRNGELSVVIDDVCNAAVNFLYLIGVGFAVA